MNGTIGFVGFGCLVPGNPCQSQTSLNSNYSSWHIDGKVATDYRFGATKLTPSLALFGGNSSNGQSWLQGISLLNVPLSGIFTYGATTSLKWSDRGVKLGLDGQYDINNWVAMGLGGYVGWSDRRTDMTGNDNVAFNLGPIGGPTASSFTAPTGRVTAFLANGEASLTTTWNQWQLRAFVGLNYDNKVPGISAASYTGPSFAPTSITPVSIFYAAETSYYTGLAATFKFGGDQGPFIARD